MSLYFPQCLYLNAKGMQFAQKLDKNDDVYRLLIIINQVLNLT